MTSKKRVKKHGHRYNRLRYRLTERVKAIFDLKDTYYCKCGKRKP